MRGSSGLDPQLVVLLLAAVVVGGALSIARPEIFLSTQNIQSMLLQMSVIGLLSLAVSVAMLTGGIDLSINAMANLTAIVAALVLSEIAPLAGGVAGNVAVTLAAIAVGLAVGIACGLFNGILIARFDFPPILATLGTMTLFTGIGMVITRGQTIFGIETFSVIGRGTILGVPTAALIFFAAALVLAAVLQARRFGFEVYLLGANLSAARFSGIDSRAVILRVYAISGALSAVAGMISLGITNSANVDFGASYVLLAILVAVLGGIAPAGGSGRIVGVVLAVLILQFLSTGLNLLYQGSGSNFLKEFAWGLTLLVVLAIGRLQSSGIAGWLGRQR